MTHCAWEKDGYLVATDPALLDLDAIHGFLSGAYWSKGIPRETVSKALDRSLCFGLYREKRQVGLARVISDFATFAYLCDVFVIEAFRGKGLATWLIECVMAHPELQRLRRFNLLTLDAHGLYAKFGFVTPPHPERYMEILKHDIYLRSGASL